MNKNSYTVNQLIEAFYNKRKRDDLLLLYFSGHGVKDEDGKLYFATPNTRRDRLMTTAISASLVNELMRKTRSRSQILLLDCCYSGAFAKGMLAKSGSAIGSSVGTNEQFQGRGRVVLTASDSMQYAFEEDELVETGSVNSIFTGAIVEGLRTWEADRDGDNRISIHELYDYIDGYVQDRTPNQQPVMWSFNTQGEMIIAEREYAPLVDEEEVEVYIPKTRIPEQPKPPVEAEQPPVETAQPSIKVEQPPLEVEHVEAEPPSQEVQPAVESVQPPTEIDQALESEQPAVGVEIEEIDPPSIEIEKPLMEKDQPSHQIESSSETVQPSTEFEQTPIELEQVETVQEEVEPSQQVQPVVEIEQPPVEVEHIELEPPTETEQQTIETTPPSPEQVSTELVEPLPEEPTESKTLPMKPVILVAIILIAVLGIVFMSGIFTPSTDEKNVTGGAAPIVDESAPSWEGAVTSKWSTTTPTLDGDISDEEWEDANKYNLTLSLLGEVTSDAESEKQASIFLKNDDENLFIAVKIFDVPYIEGQHKITLCFDQNNNGVTDAVEDNIIAQLNIGGSNSWQHITDGVIFNPPYRESADLDEGETLDVIGKFGHTNPRIDEKGTLCLEIARPLNSGDTYDINVEPGDQIGFGLEYFTSEFSMVLHTWPDGFESDDFWDKMNPLILTENPSQAPPEDKSRASWEGTVTSAWSTTSPIVDGIFMDGEWADANKYNITFFLLGGEPTSIDHYKNYATIFVKNDDENLYVAIKIFDEPYAHGWFALFFDQNNNGVIDSIEDFISGDFHVPSHQLTQDAFLYNNFQVGEAFDLDEGGTDDIYGQFSHSNPQLEMKGTLCFEIMRPLNSGDEYDLSVEPGDQIGFGIRYSDLGSGRVILYSWPNGVDLRYNWERMNTMMLAENPSQASDGGGSSVVHEGVRIVAMNRGGDENDEQLVALQQDFSEVDWVVVTGELMEGHLESADMLIMTQDDFTWGYESWEVDIIKDWLSLGDKMIWVTGDSDYGDFWMRQAESNYILEELGSSLRVESCSVEDHMSYAGDYGDPPKGATFRILAHPYTNYEGFIDDVGHCLIHGPGAVIGTDGSRYYDLIDSKPPSTSISVLMTTSTSKDSTENGYIGDSYTEVSPEYHEVGANYKVALMAVEELDSNLVIVSGDSVYGHDFGLYKPELKANTEYIQNLYEVESPTQGDILFSNILEHVIYKNALIMHDPSFESQQLPEDIRSLNVYDANNDTILDGSIEYSEEESYKGLQSVHIEGDGVDYPRVYTTVTKETYLDELSSVSFWFKHNKGSEPNTPFAIMGFWITSGEYEGGQLNLYQWSQTLPEICSEWTLNDYDSWHLRVYHPQVGKFDDFGPYTLGEIQEIYDAKLFRAGIAIGSSGNGFGEAADVYVDYLMVETS